MSTPTKDIVVPPIGTKGVFKFHTPLDSNYNIQNKELEVVELRSIERMYADREKVWEDIYQKQGIPEARFKEDVINHVPIVTLGVTDVLVYYVPASMIQSVPVVSSYTATERVISFSIGLIPDRFDLQPLYENIKTMINDTLSITPDVIEYPGSDAVMISETDYNNFKTQINRQSRSYNKSYRVLYLEEVESNKLLKKQLDDTNNVILRAHDNVKAHIVQNKG